jgi:hypothetical protein
MSSLNAKEFVYRLYEYLSKNGLPSLSLPLPLVHLCPNCWLVLFRVAEARVNRGTLKLPLTPSGLLLLDRLRRQFLKGFSLVAFRFPL